jgi:hypothetical protein
MTSPPERRSKGVERASDECGGGGELQESDNMTRALDAEESEQPAHDWAMGHELGESVCLVARELPYAEPQKDNDKRPTEQTKRCTGPLGPLRNAKKKKPR